MRLRSTGVLAEETWLADLSADLSTEASAEVEAAAEAEAFGVGGLIVVRADQRAARSSE